MKKCKIICTTMYIMKTLHKKALCFYYFKMSFFYLHSYFYVTVMLLICYLFRKKSENLTRSLSVSASSTSLLQTHQHDPQHSRSIYFLLWWLNVHIIPLTATQCSREKPLVTSCKLDNGFISKILIIILPVT